MSSSVTLSAATRQNLLSLQDTAALTSTTQNRLATGKKVNSALDNPVNFFTSQSLTARSGDLGGLLDGISNGIQTIQAANQGITNIQKLVDTAKSITSQALASKTIDKSVATAGTAAVVTAGTVYNFTVNGAAKSVTTVTGDDAASVVVKLNAAAGSTMFSQTADKISLDAKADVSISDTASETNFGFTSASITKSDTTRTSLAAQFDNLLTQIDQLAKDASFNGVNLISSGAATNKLHISFNEKDSSALDIQGADLTTGTNGLNIAKSTGTFQSDANVNTAVNALNAATNKLRAQSSTFGSNLSVVQNRQDFSKKLINILDTGSSNLTDADLNEEAANSQALTTRQSLGISALSLANQAQQGILQLLR